MYNLPLCTVQLTTTVGLSSAAVPITLLWIRDGGLLLLSGIGSLLIRCECGNLSVVWTLSITKLKWSKSKIKFVTNIHALILKQFRSHIIFHYFQISWKGSLSIPIALDFTCIHSIPVWLFRGTLITLNILGNNIYRLALLLTVLQFLYSRFERYSLLRSCF